MRSWEVAGRNAGVHGPGRAWQTGAPAGTIDGRPGAAFWCGSGCRQESGDELTSLPQRRLSMSTVLVIGSTGQVGRVVVEEALGCGFAVRAQSRNAARAQRSLPGGVEVVEASPSSADDLRSVVAGVDAVVLTHGGDMDGEGESSFYAAIPALLDALGDNNAHISLMTAMNASHSAGPSSYGFVEWKRRAERLVRASGHPYTIVRPDYQGPGDRRSTCVRATSSPAGPASTATTSPRSSWRASPIPPAPAAPWRSSAPPARRWPTSRRSSPPPAPMSPALSTASPSSTATRCSSDAGSGSRWEPPPCPASVLGRSRTGRTSSWTTRFATVTLRCWWTAPGSSAAASSTSSSPRPGRSDSPALSLWGLRKD